MDKWRCFGVIKHLLLWKLQFTFRRAALLFLLGRARRKLIGPGRSAAPSPQQVSAGESAERDVRSLSSIGSWDEGSSGLLSDVSVCDKNLHPGLIAAVKSQINL